MKAITDAQFESEVLKAKDWFWLIFGPNGAGRAGS